MGKTIIFISHKLEEVMDIADEITVLRLGQIIGTVPTAQTTTERLVQMMVGRDVQLDGYPMTVEKGNVILHVEDVCTERTQFSSGLQNISFDLQAGEVLGIAGVDGNGQTELVDAILGMIRISSGKMEKSGVSITGKSSPKIRNSGVALIPPDRHSQGLVLKNSILMNTVMGCETDKRFCKGGLLRRRGLTNTVPSILQEYDVRMPSISKDCLLRSIPPRKYFGCDRGFETNLVNYWGDNGPVGIEWRAWPRWTREVIAETEDTITYGGEVGIITESKHGESIPFQSKYPVENMDDFNRLVVPRMIGSDRTRITPSFAPMLQRAHDEKQAVGAWIDGFFAWPRELLGPENLLVSFYDEPELIHEIQKHHLQFVKDWIDMVWTVTPLDYVCFFEDMAYNHGSFISPKTFDEFLMPYIREQADIKNGAVAERFLRKQT